MHASTLVMGHRYCVELILLCYGLDSLKVVNSRLEQDATGMMFAPRGNLFHSSSTNFSTRGAGCGPSPQAKLQQHASMLLAWAVWTIQVPHSSLDMAVLGPPTRFLLKWLCANDRGEKEVGVCKYQIFRILLNGDNHV